MAKIAAGTIYGVAKFAKVVNVRAIGGGSVDDLVAAINWVTAQKILLPNELHVANGSFSDDSMAPELSTAIQNSVSNGVAGIVAAGNYWGDACDISPAYLGPTSAGLITVAAMKPETDTVNPSSNQGDCVEIFAPCCVDWGAPNGVKFGGTSSATPHVAGVFATRWSQFPLYSISQIEQLLRDAGTRDTISGVDTGTPNLLLYSHLPRRRAVGS